MDALSERNRYTGTSAMRVFANHIYEYKKGVRRMILFTVNDRYVGEAVKRLKAEDIDFELQEVGNGRTNIFFGRSECIEVVRRMITALYNNSARKRILSSVPCWVMTSACNANASASGRHAHKKYHNNHFSYNFFISFWI